MPSTTATTLASNRRRLRLAQHTRALSPSPSPEPIDNIMSSVASSSSKKNNKNKKSSNSPAPSPTLTLDLSNSNSPDNTSNTSFNSGGGGQHKQKQKKQSRSRSSQHSASSSSQQQTQQQHNSTASSNNNSRGRSRRSRAATRRSATNNTNKSSASINDDPTMSMHTTTHTTTTHMSRQQEILAGLEDVETAARDSSISRVSQQQIIVNDNNNMSQQQHNNNNNFEDERLNLHVTDSIDSDDNGTCFNSIGTTTPRQQVAAPQPPSSQTSKRIESNVYQPNLEDDDNNKTSDKVIFSSVNNIEVAQSNRTYHALDHDRGKNISQRKRSTHKIDTTSAASSNSKNLSPLHENAPQSTTTTKQSSSIEQRHLERTLHNRNQVRKGSIWDHPEDMVSNNVNNNKKDDNSTAYAEFEQDGNSYSRRPHRGGTTTRRGAGGGGGSIESSKYDMDEKMLMENAMGLANSNEGGEGEGDTDGVLLSGQNMKTALGVGAAATLGAFVLGPVGLLVGAASVGIGMGVLQIPEQQRTNVKNHAATSFEKAKHIACNLNESMATGCAKYSGTDPSEVATVVGKVVPEEIMDTCGCYGGSTNGDGEDREKSNRYQQHGGDDGGQSLTGTDLDIRSQGSSPIANAVNGVERGMNRLVGDVFGDEQQQSPVSQSMNLVGGGGGGLGDTKGRGLDGVGGQANENEDAVGRRVACGRKGQLTCNATIL